VVGVTEAAEVMVDLEAMAEADITVVGEPMQGRGLAEGLTQEPIAWLAEREPVVLVPEQVPIAEPELVEQALIEAAETMQAAATETGQEEAVGIIGTIGTEAAGGDADSGITGGGAFTHSDSIIHSGTLIMA
jgi:hypothetical protein